MIAAVLLKHNHEKHYVNTQIKNIKTPPCVKKKLEEGVLNIHGWYYQLETGEVFIYDTENHTSMTYNQALEQLFTTPEVTQKMARLVEEHAMNYLLKQSNPTTPAEYQRCSNRLIQMKRVGVSAIWDEIKVSVADATVVVFNPMFKDSAEVMTCDFFAKCSESKLTNLATIQQQLEKSKGYQQHSSQVIKISGLFHEKTTLVHGANMLTPSFEI